MVSYSYSPSISLLKLRHMHQNSISTVGISYSQLVLGSELDIVADDLATTANRHTVSDIGH